MRSFFPIPLCETGDSLKWRIPCGAHDLHQLVVFLFHSFFFFLVWLAPTPNTRLVVSLCPSLVPVGSPPLGDSFLLVLIAGFPQDPPPPPVSYCSLGLLGLGRRCFFFPLHPGRCFSRLLFPHLFLHERTYLCVPFPLLFFFSFPVSCVIRPAKPQDVGAFLRLVAVLSHSIFPLCLSFFCAQRFLRTSFPHTGSPIMFSVGGFCCC